MGQKLDIELYNSSATMSLASVCIFVRLSVRRLG